MNSDLYQSHDAVPKLKQRPFRHAEEKVQIGTSAKMSWSFVAFNTSPPLPSLLGSIPLQFKQSSSEKKSILSCEKIPACWLSHIVKNPSWLSCCLSYRAPPCQSIEHGEPGAGVQCSKLDLTSGFYWLLLLQSSSSPLLAKPEQSTAQVCGGSFSLPPPRASEFASSVLTVFFQLTSKGPLPSLHELNALRSRMS